MTAVNDHCKQPSFFAVNDWGTVVYGRARSTWENVPCPFLGTLITRINKENQMKIKIRWFRKETASDRLLNYESCHAKSIKPNIVKKHDD
jgi:hypothetical protein